MATSFREFKHGSVEYFRGAIIQYCAEKGISEGTIERKPNRQLSEVELESICAVYNNEKSVATLQSCVDNVDGIMAIVNRGISADNIYLRANPFAVYDSCLGYFLNEIKEA